MERSAAFFIHGPQQQCIFQQSMMSSESGAVSSMSSEHSEATGICSTLLSARPTLDFPMRRHHPRHVKPSSSKIQVGSTYKHDIASNVGLKVSLYEMKIWKAVASTIITEFIHRCSLQYRTNLRSRDRRRASQLPKFPPMATMLMQTSKLTVIIGNPKS